MCKRHVQQRLGKSHANEKFKFFLEFFGNISNFSQLRSKGQDEKSLLLTFIDMADDELHLETKEFDFVILGTGLTECLVSAYAQQLLTSFASLVCISFPAFFQTVSANFPTFVVKSACAHWKAGTSLGRKHLLWWNDCQFAA